jgi:DNA-binding NtrC family response regulator
MSTANYQGILVIDSDDHFRETLVNFLLSAGYENVDSAVNVDDAFEKVEQSEYSVVVLGAGSHLQAGLRSAESITGLSPNTRVILAVSAEDLPEQETRPAQQGEFLVKALFATNLPYLLEREA